MTQSTLSKYLERARRVYRPANVKSRVSPSLRAKDTTTMKGFQSDHAEYVASTAEALILVLAENYANEWIGDNELSTDYILNLAELLHGRHIDVYEIFEYLAAYDTLDEVLAFDINTGEDEFNLFF